MTSFNILNSWKESLKLFSSENLKLFFLVSIKTFLTSSKILAKKLWFIFLAYAIFASFGWSYGFDTFMLISAIFFFFMELSSVLVVRPSLELRDLNYFCKYGIRLITYILFYGILISFFFKNLNIEIFNSNLIFVLIFLMPLKQTCVFFVLDGKFNVENFFFFSWFRAIKAFLYYFPIFFSFGMLGIIVSLLKFVTSFIVLQLISVSVDFPFRFFTNFLVLMSEIVLKCLINTFIASLIVNYYTKIKHSNFTLFFNK